jgi:predicted small secreted protein
MQSKDFYYMMEVRDMKKLLSMMFLLLVLAWVLAGCSNTPKTAVQNIPVGTYIMRESKEPAKPIVLLKDGDRFTFTYSLLSSYYAIGSYEIDDGNLILRTDDGENKYVFKIKDNTLIFNEKESSEIPSYANVPDGAVFEETHE